MPVQLGNPKIQIPNSKSYIEYREVARLSGLGTCLPPCPPLEGQAGLVLVIWDPPAGRAGYRRFWHTFKGF